MNVAIIADHDNKQIQLSTLNAVTAAKSFGGKCCLFILGSSLDNVIKDANKIVGIDSIIAIESDLLKEPVAEHMVECLLPHVNDFDVILAASTTLGKNHIPRLAAKLNVNAYSDVMEIKEDNIFVRPTYAGNVLQTVKALDKVKVLTIRATAFIKAETNVEQNIKLTKIDISTIDSINSIHGCEKTLSERPELTEASVIVSGGRGLQSREQFSLITELADKLGAAIGASRAAVDAGFISNDHQVGQTGKIVAPELYIAVGISGAIQHLAGIKDSKVIVAINKDPDAPIFQVANLGLVGDAFELVPELIKKL